MRKWWKQLNPMVKRMALAVFAVVILMAVVLGISRWRKGVREEQKVTKGIAYLSDLEKQDVEGIGKEIKQIRDKYSLAMADTDEGAVWAAFSDAAILGDSRAVGFYYHEFVPEERVLAQSGGKITDITEMPEYVERLKALKPKHIFLCFGLNDVGIGIWPTGQEYAAEYEKQMQILIQALPESEIYINSILPAVGVGLSADPDYPRIGEYNEALKTMAEEKGYHYIDNTKVAEEHQDLYQEDGLHVQTEFYKYWAANMLTGVDEL